MNPKRAGTTATRISERHRPNTAVGSLIAIFAAAFLVKLIVMWPLKDHVLVQADAGLDTTAYVALARRVIAGDLTLGPGLYFVSPLYIYFLAGVLAVSESFTAVRLLQIALGAVAVVCVYVSANEWFGRRAAWLAAGLATLTGLFAFYESLLVQAALDPFLTAVALASLALGLKRRSDRWYMCAGLAFGVQMLNRPNIAIAALGIAMCLAVTRHRRAAAMFAAAVAVALAPAALRNFAVTGSWSPVSSHGGLNFYIGNNAEADGTYRPVPGITPNLEGQQEDARRVAERAAGHPLDDAEVSGHFYRLGFTWMREHPRAAAKLFVRKLSLVFSSANVWLNYSYPFFKYEAGTALRALAVGPWIVIPLGLVGLIVAAPKPMTTEYLIWASFVPMYAVAVAVFFVADRYTLPLLIPLCAAAGGALDVLVDGLWSMVSGRWSGRGSMVDRRPTNDVTIAHRPWPIAHYAVFVVLLIAVNRPVNVDDGVAETRVRMAERLVTLDRYEEAEQWADRAEKIYPVPGLVHFRVGQRLLSRDRPAAAVTHFEKALRFDPGQPEVELVLGETLLNARRPSEAIVHLRRALDAGFHPDLAGYDLVRALGATGDRVEAIRVLEKLSPARSKDVEQWVALGDLGIKLQEPSLAATFFRKAIAARSDFAPAFLGLAVTEANMGLLPDARRHLEESLRLDPSAERARELQKLLK